MLNYTDAKIGAIRYRLQGWENGERIPSFSIIDLSAFYHEAKALLDAFDAAQAERDEARELHAEMCDKYADAVLRLHRISNIIAGYQSAHSQGGVEVGPDREAVAKNGKYVGTIPATVADEALDTRYRLDMKDAGRGHLLR